MPTAIARLGTALWGTFVFLSAATSMAAQPVPAAVSAFTGKFGNLYSLFEHRQFAELDRQISQIQKNYEAGKVTDQDLLDAYRAIYNPNVVPDYFYDDWVKQFPKSHAAHVMRGLHYKILAHKARGGQFSNQTPQANFDKMDQLYRMAYPDLQVSLGMTRKPVMAYYTLLDMANHVASRDQKRQLYENAIKAVPDSFILRRQYMHTLETRWGGSIGEMADFLNDCKDKGLSKDQMNVLEAMVYKDQGWIAFQAEQYAVALPQLTKSAALVSGKEQLMAPSAAAETFGEIGDSYLRTGKNADAVVWYTRALTVAGGCDCEDHYYANRGLAQERLGHVDDAMRDYITGADKGNDWAQSLLGVYYWKGTHVPVDKKKAAHYMKMAVDQGEEAAIKNWPLLQKEL
ncbi:SEL1-like repeat protein [Silvimonas amylolytica]|uniref:TPR repeat n=1 Tax=Silvimonas amylolytica TaxID=449663 RepID=A0ABQ2PP35_9NEIS|nr:SEL1-like repeat protein [Silvimonas amylolytica]GGP27145.1 hypothetical protein GCM10010971_29640 [Silvimonas amylolytica]